MWLFLIFALIPFYLLGAFPTGMLLAKSKGVDITAVGSGNVGATNIARTLGKKAGIITLFIDAAKGALAIGCAELITSNTFFIGAAGVACVAGHCFSIPKKLRGGKGVATALGTLIALSPIIALQTVVVFLILFLSFRIVSVASVAATAAAPGIVLATGSTEDYLWALTTIAIIVIARHWKNLERLARGEEARFNF